MNLLVRSSPHGEMPIDCALKFAYDAVLKPESWVRTCRQR